MNEDTLHLIALAVTPLTFILSVVMIRVSAAKDRTAKLISDALLSKEVKDLKTKLDTETGGNSNGLRQALNEHSVFVKDKLVEAHEAHLKIEAKADRAEVKFDKLSSEVSELKGAFHERARMREGVV